MQNILIIEDEPSIADNIVLSLEREGFTVFWAPTLEQARTFFESEHLDLIVLDIGLPDGNGFDFCRELRVSSNIPVLMLTARSDEVDRIVGLEIGADDYVTKPFSPRELAARVKAILRRTQHQVNDTEAALPPSCLSKLKINPETFRATCMDQHLPLSAHEFHLLEALASQPSRIFSRRQLLEKAWEDPNSAMERTVDAHIKSLRAKMKQLTEIDPIVTHRGFGYSFEEM